MLNSHLTKIATMIMGFMIFQDIEVKTHRQTHTHNFMGVPPAVAQVQPLVGELTCCMALPKGKKGVNTKRSAERGKSGFSLKWRKWRGAGQSAELCLSLKLQDDWLFKWVFYCGILKMFFSDNSHWMITNLRTVKILTMWYFKLK